MGFHDIENCVFEDNLNREPKTSEHVHFKWKTERTSLIFRIYTVAYSVEVLLWGLVCASKYVEHQYTVSDFPVCNHNAGSFDLKLLDPLIEKISEEGGGRERRVKPC